MLTQWAPFDEQGKPSIILRLAFGDDCKSTERKRSGFFPLSLFIDQTPFTVTQYFITRTIASTSHRLNEAYTQRLTFFRHKSCN